MNIMKSTIATLVALFSCSSAIAQEGAWHGDLNVYGTKLPLVFHFSTNGCTMDSPSQGAKGIATEWKRQDDGKVVIDIPTINGKYEGQYDGKEIKGTFSQNGVAMALTLTPGEKQIKRPQTPVPPFHYQTEEVTFDNGNTTLHGTLTLPENMNSKTPVVLMVTGSGQQNRDEELFFHKPFAVIADALAKQGIASLRYDDRGFGNPDIPFMSFTTDIFKQDAACGIMYLRKRFKKVGVLGHSEGGTIALILAAEGKADFVVSLAGMAVSGKETLLDQNRVSLSSLQIPEEVVNNYCNRLSQAFDDIKAGRRIEDIETGNIPGGLKKVFETAMQQCESPYIRHFISIDVRPQLVNIKCPVLALNGTKDSQVNCENNLKALGNGLKNCRHKIMAMDGLNHLFQHCNTGAVLEYSQIEETFSPEAIQEIIRWINGL